VSPFEKAPEGFTPETLELLDRAFTATWCELQWKKSSATSKESEQATRRAIVKSIIKMAPTSIREPARLEIPALNSSEKVKPHTRAIVHLPE